MDVKLSAPEPLYPGIDAALSDMKDYHLAVFERRYGGGCLAIVAFDLAIVDLMKDIAEDEYRHDCIYDLVKMPFYPLAKGNNVSEALAAVDAKMRKIPTNINCEELGRWTRYVDLVNGLIKNNQSIKSDGLLNFDISK